MFGFIAKGMLKGELEAFLALRYAVLLKGDLNPRPFGLLLAFVHWQMPLFEKLDLIAHIRNHESGGGSLGEAFYRKMKPGFVGGMRICLNGQMKLCGRSRTVLLSF